MSYEQPEYAAEILPEHKQACAVVFDIVKNSFELSIAMAAQWSGENKQ